MKYTRAHGLLSLALAVLLLPSVATATDPPFQVQCPNDIDRTPTGNFPGPEDIDHDGDHNLDSSAAVKCMWIVGGDGWADMGDGATLYTFGFGPIPLSMNEDDAQSFGIEKVEQPAPLIFVNEGQELYLNLGNVGTVNRPDLNDPHTVHWHGYPNQAPFFDGLPEAALAVKLGSIITFYYKPVFPGTYFYHCHVEATEHIQMGMIGNLYVNPAQNGTSLEYPPGSGKFFNKFAYNDGDGSTGYDVQVPLQITDFDAEVHEDHINVQPLFFYKMNADYSLFNGRGYPDTIVAGPITNSQTGYASQPVNSLIQASVGKRILLRVSSVSTAAYHTVRVLGIPMTVVGKDARLLRGPSGANLSYKTTSVTLGGGESIDVILDTAGLAPGTYYVYARTLNDLNNFGEARGGLMTEVRLTAP